MTTFYLLAEVVGGLITGSLALLADAGHMLTDVGGLGLALLAINFAARPATPERTYGYYRVEILAALANAILLVGVSIYILYEAYQRFRNPPEVQSTAMLLVAARGDSATVASTVPSVALVALREQSVHLRCLRAIEPAARGHQLERRGLRDHRSTTEPLSLGAATFVHGRAMQRFDDLFEQDRCAGGLVFLASELHEPTISVRV
jgi:hypothetical protein